MTLTPELIALIAAVGGLLLGVLITLVFAQRSIRRLATQHSALETQLKSQAELEQERQNAIGHAAEQLSNVFEQHA